MSRKLILLNVVLVGIVVYTGVLLRNEMQSAKAREAKMHGARVSGTPLAAFVTLVEQQPSLAATYGRIAINTLFHPSRNSEVLLPAAPVPVVVPKPMPALPGYFGTMNLGDGPTGLLAMGNRPAQPVAIGEMIGPFRLIDVNIVDITFEWDGYFIRRTLDQLTDHTIRAVASTGNSGNRSVSESPSIVEQVVLRPLGPGPMTSQGVATCLPGDSMPYGTIQNGLRKVEIPTPWANACVWEPVGRRTGGQL
ncbi:MAG TPA: hypothetical protein VKE70_35545 [Candidatus Solibacter sp.]|nr:hypothetical protein [Candidatus Solibacter sp.]